MTPLSDLVIKLMLVHLVADWLLQNHWMAVNKGSLAYPAAWVHSGIHAALSFIVVPWYAAAIIGLSHLVIDTRVVTDLWGRLMRQTDTGPWAMPVALWRDQVVHVLVIAVVAWCC